MVLGTEISIVHVCHTFDTLVNLKMPYENNITNILSRGIIAMLFFLPLIPSLLTHPVFSGYEHTSNGCQPPSSPGGSKIHVLLQHGCSRGILGYSDTADDWTSGAATGILQLACWLLSSKPKTHFLRLSKSAPKKYKEIISYWRRSMV